MTLPSELTASNSYENALIEWRASWLADARPEQIAPPGDWLTWLILSGRGWGKTRTGGEDTLWNALSIPKSRWAIVAPTNNDCRRVCFEGESGILEKCPKYFRRKKDWRRDELELTLPNGSKLIGYSAEKPDRLRGPQHHGAWCDELASWGAVIRDGKKSEGQRLKETWDMLKFGLRLGVKPRVIITTTPRPIKFLRDLVKNPRAYVTTGSTFDNEKNLAGSALDEFREVYEGTRLGRQELYGDILSENENALWRAHQFEALGFRVGEYPELVRIVIAVDPAVTDADGSDETGIIAAGIDENRHVYLLADESGKYSPLQWAKKVLHLYERFDADCVTAETNQGGDLVESNLRAHAGEQFFRFKGVHAKRGKYLRAEPVAAYYEKGKVHHVGKYETLESQMTDFTGSLTNGSPDRLDAAVYAVTELMLGTVNHAFF